MQALAEGDQDAACELLSAHPRLAVALFPDLSGSERGYLPLHVAAFSGQERVTALLLELGADPSVPERSHKGWSPLHFAAQQGHEEVATLLLERGAALDQPDADGRTPLHWCALNGRPGVARLLLERGADRSLRDAEGLSALDHADEREHRAVVELLMG